jgi:hypothetical protein
VLASASPQVARVWVQVERGFVRAIQVQTFDVGGTFYTRRNVRYR